ncbi:MAG: cation-translocating P-type ATPase [Synechococcales cyanobacterium C42_A2020_086]|nr:cation-translocating P-type ATPase [Synechococcales cyanobacterium C42_A2020_086]
MHQWYQLEPEAVLQHLEVEADQGLSLEEVNCRQQQYGANELIEQPAKSPWRMIWEQLTASTILILLAAAAISALLGDLKDTVAILAIVILTTLIGFNQEYRTSQAIAALKKLSVPKVRVCRGGEYQEISALALVPGDILLLEAGNLVPADGRLLESVNLRIQEATLTGEAAAVDKQTAALSGSDLPLADRLNMVYRGTMVTYGRGRAVVTATGMNTELGRIAHLVQIVEPEPTPLQQRLDGLGQRLVMAVLLLTAIIFALGVLRGEPLQLMFLTAVSIAVGVVPEGLPAIVTIALAMGAQRMLHQQALIRNLPAVETLGSVTVIGTDKTGTLTANQMTVTRMLSAEQLTAPSSLLSPAGETAASPEALKTLNCCGEALWSGEQSNLDSTPLLLLAMALCNDAVIADNGCPDQSLGDPTEVALGLWAAQAGFLKTEWEQWLPRVAEIPFDANRRRMTTLHRLPNGGYLVFTKGAVATVLEQSSQIWGRSESLDAVWRHSIEAANHQLAQQGSRVLGVAVRGLPVLPDAIEPALIEQNSQFLGLVALADPLRPEAETAVHTCRAAGIRVVMITGDQPLVAQQIAQQLGMADQALCFTGADLHSLSIDELASKAAAISVYARVSPEQKLTIVQALQTQGEIVAMTGDGVNDAPALRQADIGIAMGNSGTDVAKEAADMVLLNDNFATIVAAVAEGRVIYDNIRKCIKYLLGGNSAEIWIMLLAPILGMPLPLLPIQILWVNLLSDGLPALALSIEPAEQDVMQRPPRPPDESIFANGMGWDIFWIGLTIGLVALAAGYPSWRQASYGHWQTMLFTILTFSETLIVLALRSDRRSLIQLGLGTNRPLLGAVILTLFLQLAVIYLPGLQDLFQTASLSLSELGLSLLVSSSVFWLLELRKGIWQRGRPTDHPAEG